MIGIVVIGWLSSAGLVASALLWLCRRLRAVSEEDSYECLRRGGISQTIRDFADHTRFRRPF